MGDHGRSESPRAIGSAQEKRSQRAWPGWPGAGGEPSKAFSTICLILKTSPQLATEFEGRRSPLTCLSEPSDSSASADQQFWPEGANRRIRQLADPQAREDAARQRD